MNSIARPRRRCSSASRLTICARTETSSAETGSSATSSSGPRGQGARDADALALTAGELVRDSARACAGGQADLLEQRGDAGAALGARRQAVHEQRLEERRRRSAGGD